MLNKEKIAEYQEIVRTRYPTFSKVTRSLGHHGSCPDYNGGKTDMGAGSELYIPSIRETARCCGFAELDSKVDPKVQSGDYSRYEGCDVGQLKNVEIISSYTEVQKALFALWLNDNPNTAFSAVLCSTANYQSFLSKSEQILVDCGFVPICRSKNRNHGSNFITLWLLKLNEDVPFSNRVVSFKKPLELPKEEVVAEPARTIKKLVRKTLLRKVPRPLNRY